MATITLYFCVALLFAVARATDDFKVEVGSGNSNSQSFDDEASIQSQANQFVKTFELRYDPIISVSEHGPVEKNVVSPVIGVPANLVLNETMNVSATTLKENNESAANISADVKNKLKVECTPRILLENEVPTVQITNGTMLLKSLSPSNTNVSTGECVVVLFYSSQCIFSARMGPHYNALPRVFPDIAFYAIDVTEHSNLYIRFGLVYVPNVMLFHNAKPIARFNETTLNLDQFVKFVNKLTGLQHNGTLNVTSADMTGPVPATLTKRTDHLLVLAWAFTLSCLCLGFVKSAVCRHIVEFLKNTWQEAEAQHEHED